MTIYTGTRSVAAVRNGRKTIARHTATGWIVTLKHLDLCFELPPELCITDDDVTVYCASENWPSPFLESEAE